MKRKAGRPKQGKQNKLHCSIRLEPHRKKRIIKAYGSLQKWIDTIAQTEDCLENDRKVWDSGTTIDSTQKEDK